MGKELVEKRNELQAKQKKLADIFAECKDKDGNIDLMKTDKLNGKDAKGRQEQVIALNKELDDLGAEVESLAAMENAKKKADEYTHPGNGQGEESGQRKVKTFGEMFVESDAFKSRGKSAIIEGVGLKTLMDTSAGWAPESLRTGRVVESAQRPIQIIDLIPAGQTGQNAVVYMEETTFTNNAAETAEGGQYGESALALTEQTSSVRKIAVFIPVTDEQLDDVAQAQSYVNNRLRFQLRQRLDSQIVNGDGSAPNLTGILNASGIQSQAKGTDDIATAIHKGITLVSVVGRAMVNAVLMHPYDWQRIRLTKDVDGNYLWGPPSESGPARIWGFPIVTSTALPEGTAIAGDFANFIELTERQGIEVKITDSHSDYFIKGKQAIRADFRVALPIYRPAAFCEVTGINA